MTSFYYYDQNPSGFCFLVQIRAFVIFILAGITKFKYERKNVMDSVVVIKWRHRANGLLEKLISFKV